MAFLRIFKVPKNQKFEYRPRHWDPIKDEIDERRRRADERRQQGVEGAKARIASELRRGAGRGMNERYRQQQVFRSNLILFVVVALLVLGAYIFLQVFLPDLLKIAN